MNETKDAVEVANYLAGAGLLSPVVVVAAVKWMFTQYQKKAEELDRQRKSYIDHELAEIEDMIRALRMDIGKLKDSMNATDKDLAVMIEKTKFQASDVQKIMRAFHGYVESSSKRLNAVESQVSELSKDVYLVTKKKG